MNPLLEVDIGDQIISKAKSLGAHSAGFARVDDLVTAPSFTFAPKLSGISEGIGSRDNELGLKPGEVAWPEKAKSVLVIAVEHPREQPEMDWWFGRVSPPGNKVLTRIVKELCEWIPETFGIGTVHLPYHVEKGGIYLKDAAVIAGLGCIGKNNILITPEYGPRVRLRSLTVSLDIPSTGPLHFYPCADCGMPCRNACPQDAFGKQIYTKEEYNQEYLPGGTGEFFRPTCNIQMESDNDAAEILEIEGFEKPVKVIKYCRRCELACPVGRENLGIGFK